MSKSLIRPERWWPALAIALAGKVCLLLLMLLEHGTPIVGPWYLFGGDAIGYLDPIDSLLNGQGYHPDHRMPGYGAPYLLLRIFMERPAALQSLVLLHVLASAIAVVLLARLAFNLTNDQRIFRWTFWLALISTYASFYDRQILTESFSVMALTLAAQQATTWFKTGRRSHLLVAGSAITWLIFMKPVYLPALAILGAAVLLHRGKALRTRVLATLTLGVPFLVADGAWCVRNAVLHGEFRPLTDGAIYPDLRAGIKYPLLRLMQAYGTSFIWWDPTAEIRWFNIRYGNDGQVQFADRQPPLPAYVYTDQCPQDSLRAIADAVERYNNSADEAQRTRMIANVTKSCDRCIESFRNEHPFHYQVTARLRMLKTFLLHSGTSALMGKPGNELDPVRLAIRGFYSFLYLGSFLLGSIWALRSFLSRSVAPDLRLTSALLLYGVTIFPFGVRMTEFRYSTAIYPLALLLAILFAVSIWDKISSQRRGAA